MIQSQLPTYVAYHSIFVCNIKQLGKRAWGIATVFTMYVHAVTREDKLAYILTIAVDCIFELSTVQGLKIFLKAHI